jgi:hypothetical protein
MNSIISSLVGKSPDLIFQSDVDETTEPSDELLDGQGMLVRIRFNRCRFIVGPEPRSDYLSSGYSVLAN